MKHTIRLIPFLFVLLAASCKKTDIFKPKPEFIKFFGGDLASIVTTRDGGYAFTGSTGPQNEAGDGYIAKINAYGETAWEKYVGCCYAPDNLFSIVETRDKGYIVAGGAYRDITQTEGTYKQVWLIKVDKNGNTVWEKTYGGFNEDEAYSIISSPDGGYIIAGHTWSSDKDVTRNQGLGDAWILKIDEDGRKLWQKSYGGSGVDQARAIAADHGGYIVAGYSESSDGDVRSNKGQSDLWTFRIDLNGNLLWQKTYGGSNVDVANAVFAFPGGYAVAGNTESNDGDVTGHHGASDAWVIRTGRNGELIWQRALGGSDIETANAITADIYGELVMAGSTASNDGDVVGNMEGRIAWVAALDIDGSISWQQALNGYRKANSMVPISAESFVLSGPGWVRTLKRP